MFFQRSSIRALSLSIMAVTALVLSGCSTFAPKDAETSTQESQTWDEYQAEAAALKNFTLNGKIGIRTENDSQTATFDWLQDDQAYTIRLKGPLGQGAAEVSGDQYYATLIIAGEQPFQAATPEELLAYRLGWALPVRQATYWLKGLPAPDSKFKAKYKDNRLSHLKQMGWNIEYSRYVNNPTGLTPSLPSSLPSKVIFTHDDLTLTLILRQWLPLEP
jgi:outer membrane lipoprotein LolB